MVDNGAMIIGTGMVTPVGLNAAQSASSVRAGINRFGESEFLNRDFEPITLSLLPEEVLPHLRSELAGKSLPVRQARMLQLATAALHELVASVGPIDRFPVYLGGPEMTPKRAAIMKETFLANLLVQSGIRFDLVKSCTFLKGRASGLIALEEAGNYLRSGNGDVVVVGGVDSCLDPVLLRRLEKEGRLLGPTTMDGFIPGEGAAFVLLTKIPEASRTESASLKVSRVSSAFEPGHLYSEEPYRGDGLSMAFRRLFEEKRNEPVQELYTAMNGENHWAKELGVAFTRNSSAFAAWYRIHHPADCIGDTGAASGIILIGLAAMGIEAGYRRSPVLVTCSSDTGNCAVVAVSKI